MDLSFAPMEGVTYGIYRQIHAEMFPGADRYYAPFVAPDSSGSFKAGAFRDLLPEVNKSVRLIPQILCNAPAPFLRAAEKIAELGYEEINLNIGCPSGTVVAKHKGAGMLADLSGLDRCLHEIFVGCPVRVSIKTRLGLHSTDEFPMILEVYQKYPLARLIVHARDRDGMYRSLPDREAFSAALACRFPVEYNGDVFTPADALAVENRFPEISGLMLGRGAAANPALFRQLRGGSPLSASELRAFHDRLCDAYLGSGLSPHYTVSRMKELWFYQLALFPDSERAGKNIFKARNYAEYLTAVSALFESTGFDPNAGFHQ